MRVKVLSILLATFVSISFIACQTPSPDDEPDDVSMTPTSDYNYMLDPATLIEAAEKFHLSHELFDDTTREFAFIKETEISGKTDGRRIVVDAKYSYANDYLDYAAILERLPKDKAKLHACVPSDRMIGYAKLPGFQSLFDAMLEITDLETPEGEINEFAQMVRMASGFINLQEDIFKWMGPETGIISYVATDQEGKKYMSSALAISINNAQMANEKLKNLLRMAGMFMPDFNLNELIETSQYKTFMIDKLRPEALGLDPEYQGGFGMGLGSGMPAMMYADDWLFISDEHGLKQLADIYDPGGPLGQAASLLFTADIDKMMDYSEEFEAEILESLKGIPDLPPEQLAILQAYYERLEQMKVDKDFGTTSLIITFEKDHIKAQMRTTKQFIELMEFMKEWMEAIEEADEQAF